MAHKLYSGFAIQNHGRIILTGPVTLRAAPCCRMKPTRRHLVVSRQRYMALRVPVVGKKNINPPQKDASAQQPVTTLGTARWHLACFTRSPRLPVQLVLYVRVQNTFMSTVVLIN